MRKLLIKRTAAMAMLLFICLLAVPTSRALAQNPGEAPQGEQPQSNNPGVDWKEQLKLTPDQLDKIRAITEQNRTEAQAINRHVNQARRSLDEAIYSDNVNEAEIEQRARELAEAQAAQVRMRALTELSIRRVLTPEQLSTFREIRRQRAIENQIKRRQENANQPKPLNNKRIENGINQQAPGLRRNGQPRKNGP